MHRPQAASAKLAALPTRTTSPTRPTAPEQTRPTPPARARVRRGIRLMLLAPLAIGVAALASLAPGSPAGATCAGAGSNHAALVVEHADGSVVTRCVAFDTQQISAQDLLDASGVKWQGQTFSGMGMALCSVDQEPASFSSCLGTDRYWELFVAKAGGAWQASMEGVSTTMLSDGDAEGLLYAPIKGDAPALPSGASVCPDALASASAAAAAASAAAAAPPSAAASGAAMAGASAAPDPTAPTTATHNDLGLLAAIVVVVVLIALGGWRLALRRRHP